MIIHEGSVDVETISIFEKGPGSLSPGFYNRTMEVSRDLTVALLKSMKPGIALDSMAGTGIRGLRIAKETEWQVVLNDKDSRNTEIQKKNVSLNSLDIEVMRDDYFGAVSSRKWDYIDVDPFGSPTGLVEAAVMNLKNNGVVGVTMTDTANLEGKTLAKGYRLYGSMSIHGKFSREVSTRIFLKYVMERGASVGRAGRPLLVVRDGHFIRAFVQFKKGNKAADESLKELKLVEVEGSKIGPLFTGKMYDPVLLDSISAFPFSESSRSIFSNFKNEDLMFLFYENSNGEREVKKSKILETLRNSGFMAGNTNFSEKGIKTDAGEDEYKKIVSSL